MALATVALAFLACNGCKNDPKTVKAPPIPKPPKPATPAAVPSFSADSAFVWIEKQLAFGPRCPSSEAHANCRNFLAAEFKRLGLTVIEQKFDAKKFDGSPMSGVNVIAQYRPDLKYRVLFSAHWDSRWTSDHDPAGSKDCVPAADDGASGAAILLEIARVLQQNKVEIGVDLCLWDLEDQGDDSGNSPNSWCLGSQYWSKNPHIDAALFGINLDMVGSKGARFGRERASNEFAPAIVEKVWRLGQSMGFGQFFVDDFEGPITDDHVFVSRVVPCIDVINRQIGTKSGFGDHWHTQNDNINVIDRATLKAVGQTMTAVIYRSYNQTF